MRLERRIVKILWDQTLNDVQISSKEDFVEFFSATKNGLVRAANNAKTEFCLLWNIAFNIAISQRNLLKLLLKEKLLYRKLDILKKF